MIIQYNLSGGIEFVFNIIFHVKIIFLLEKYVVRLSSESDTQCFYSILKTVLQVRRNAAFLPLSLLRFHAHEATSFKNHFRFPRTQANCLEHQLSCTRKSPFPMQYETLVGDHIPNSRYQWKITSEQLLSRKVNSGYFVPLLQSTTRLNPQGRDLPWLTDVTALCLWRWKKCFNRTTCNDQPNLETI